MVYDSETWKALIGESGLPNLNISRVQLLDFSACFPLSITNILFIRKTVNKCSWQRGPQSANWDPQITVASGPIDYTCFWITTFHISLDIKIIHTLGLNDYISNTQMLLHGVHRLLDQQSTPAPV